LFGKVLIDVLWQDGFIQEKTTEHDNKKRAKQKCIGMKIPCTLYKSKIYYITKNKKWNKAQCYFPKDRSSEMKIEKERIKDEFNGCKNIVQPIILDTLITKPNTQQFNDYS
jgi:hypothetical protein